MGFQTFKVNRIEDSSASNRNQDIYAPKWKKELPDGKYVAYIRLLPNMINPESSIVAKEISWLREPSDRSGRAISIDNPNTVGQRDNAISKLFWDLFNTNDEEKKALAKDCLQTTKNYYAFIQVISDHNLQGDKNKDFKVMIWRFGGKLYDKIIEESADYDIIGLTSTHVLKLVITHQGGNNDFSLSKFVDADKLEIPSTYCFEKDGQYYEVNDEMTDEECEYVESQLKELELSLNRDDMEYHPWTPEQEDMVMKHCERVRQYAYPELMAGRQSFAGVIPQAPVTAACAPSMPQVSNSRIDDNGTDLGVNLQAAGLKSVRPVSKAPVAQAAPKAPVISKPTPVAQPSQPSGYSDGDLADLLGEE